MRRLGRPGWFWWCNGRGLWWRTFRMNNYWATAHVTVTCGCSMTIHSNAHHHKPHPLRHQNQPGLPDFSRVRWKTWGDLGTIGGSALCVSTSDYHMTTPVHTSWVVLLYTCIRFLSCSKNHYLTIGIYAWGGVGRWDMMAWITLGMALLVIILWEVSVPHKIP